MTKVDPRRLDLVHRELRRLDPDIVALQEVVHTPQCNQLGPLFLGMSYHYTHQAQVMATVPPASDRYGGNAIATRWPHRIVEVLDLRAQDAQDVPWCTLVALVSLPEQGDILFIAATTSWRLEAEAVRERQVQAIADLDARHRTELPTIIAGDFNASPDASSIRYLAGLQSIGGRSVHYHDAWAVAGDGPGYTWSANNPNTCLEIEKIVRQPNHERRVDYVFIGSWHAHPRAYGRVGAARLVLDQPDNGLWGSDHFGVLVDLEIAKVA
jgi:endonuclease/exonuclease/phosphatase family metal-dependent hydrolase